MTVSEMLADIALRPRDEEADRYLRLLALTNAAAAVGSLGEAGELIGRLDSTSGHAGDTAFRLAARLHARTQDDFHPLGRSHIGAVTIPATLALADLAGDRTIGCLAAGYEVMCAVAMVYSPIAQRQGYRPTGMFGPLGAATSAAVALGLDRDGIANAIGLATVMSAGTNQSWISGTDEWLLELGAAARAGVDAATLTAAGATASSEAFEGKAGWSRAFFEDPGAERLTRELSEWHPRITEVATKPYPVSGIAEVPTHLGCLMHERLDGEPPDSVVVTMSAAELAYPGSTNRGPFPSRSAALMSVAFCVACGLTDGFVALDRLEHPDDPELTALIKRIEVRPDESVPETEATVEVTQGNSRHSESLAAKTLLFPTWDEVEAGPLARRSEADIHTVEEMREVLGQPEVPAARLAELMLVGAPQA